MTKAFFEEQAMALADSLYRVSASLLRRPADRQDAIQDALLKAWEKRHTLREEHLFRPWLMRILVNECHTLLRKTRRILLVDPPEQDTGQVNSALRETVMELPEKIRLVMVLHYMEDMPVTEVAEALRIPAGTVKSRLSRGRELLRTTLREEAWL